MRRSPINRRPPQRADSDPAYLRWIRAQPCSVPNCKARHVQAHHAGAHGLGQLAHDRTAIPLCDNHHWEFHNQLGKRFWGHYDLDRDGMIAALNRAYETERAA